MKLSLVPLIASAFLSTIAIAGLIPRQGTPCSVTKIHKTIEWNFYISGGRRPTRPPVEQYDLVTPGRGFAWREAYGASDLADHVTKPILFDNDQGWKVVNCSWYFTAEDPKRNACTSPEFAILSTSGSGKLGSLVDLTYPAISYWAVYDLVEFRLTPLVLDKSRYDDMVTVEVYGWREDGSQTNTMSFKIKGSEVGYKVSLPKGEWDAILMWQVIVKNGSGNIQYLIDDMVIEEYAIDLRVTDCAHPTQTPTSTPALKTLNFDDIDANPSAPLPTPYKSFTFDSPWSVNKLEFAVSPPNALYAAINDEITTPIPKILAMDFMWDADSFRIHIDSTQTATTNLADLDVTIRGYGPCFNIFRYSGNTAGSFRSIKPTEYSFDVDLKSFGYRKQRAMDIYVYDNVALKRVPFWIDNLVVHSWEGQLGGLPACERCGKFIAWHCEYPRHVRNPL